MLNLFTMVSSSIIITYCGFHYNSFGGILIGGIVIGLTLGFLVDWFVEFVKEKKI